MKSKAYRIRMNRNNKTLRDRRKKQVRTYKLNKGCQICGYNKCARALTFHHPNDNKDKNMYTGRGGMGYVWSINRMMEEINKCIVVCFNCHMELHNESEVQ